MKRSSVVLMFLVASLAGAVGCHSNQAQPAKVGVFHVKAVTPDAPIDLIGSLNGKEYSLSVNRKNVPLYIAYYEPIGPEDVGKEFHAQVKDDSVFIDLPEKGTVRYDIKSVSESQ